MAIVHARCTQCDANIETDSEKDAGICPYCGTAFVTEKVIDNYNTYVTNNLVLDEQTKTSLPDAVQISDLAAAEKNAGCFTTNGCLRNCRTSATK